MPTISPLPESTTRLLCSPIAITTPVTLVKELIDNSIDAKATSIEVVISSDTVKKIEVRDNGIGIHPDDYDALGRRGHTSKLRSFEELRTRFGKTLGFRGEALASANSLAQVIVTTKIASEPVAAILHLVPGTGGILKQQPTSAPVGTTVTITGLFHSLPVREQVAIKDSAKTIDKIRELLRSYTMARPQLRYSLKVLQLTKHGWSYSPKADCSVKEAAVQLFGPEITSYCFEKTFEVRDPTGGDNSAGENPTTSSNRKYIFEAFILKPDSSPTKVIKQRYFSVDDRPVTAKRGTIKKLLDIYVEHISALSRQDSSTEKHKNYFIRLNIKCSPGSYDANIEASKDDVMFSDEKVVLDGFKDLCREVYKSPSHHGLQSQSSEHSSVPSSKKNLGARKPLPTRPQAKFISDGVGHHGTPPVQTPSQAPEQLILQEQSPLIIPQSSPSPLQYMSQHVNNPEPARFEHNYTHVSTTRVSSTLAEDLENKISNIESTRSGVNLSIDSTGYSHGHPLRKLPRSIQPLPALQEKPGVNKNLAAQDTDPLAAAKTNAPNSNLITEWQPENKLSQNNSWQSLEYEPPMTPDPPILRQVGAAPRDLDVPPSQRHSELQGPVRQLRSRVPGSPYRSPISSPSRMASQNAMDSIKMPIIPKPRRRRNPLPWTPPSINEKVAIRNNLLSHARDEPITDNMKQTTISFNGDKGARKRQPQIDNSSISHQVSQGQGHQENWFRYPPTPTKDNSNHTLSFQKAFYNSEKKQGQIQVNLKSTQNQPSAHLRNIYLPNEASSSKINEPTKTTLASDDPRAYLLRRQKSIGIEEKGVKPRKIRRLKSSLLPLENIPLNDQIHSLMMTEIWDTKALRTYLEKYATYDGYITKGVMENGLEMSLDEGSKAEKRLRALLNGINDGGESVFEINICSLLKGHKKWVWKFSEAIIGG
ncbi:hypothetical protein F5Y11DRAFT_363451 [Daldinia sp. FL1419]|nr:hypothetical protein F5Y11DRAFT_363451 [Daldinia sp. FL1419]